MYVYELPTTGALSFTDICIDSSIDKIHANHVLEATQARANVRMGLKTNKRTQDVEKDYLALIKSFEDYIPLLRGIMDCVDHGDLKFKAEPLFSWRTTLSAHIFNNSPRISVPGLYADLSFTLLTYAFTLANIARNIVQSLGSYEHDRAITDAQRKRKDEQLNIAFKFLSKASSVFLYIADKLLPEWEAQRSDEFMGFSKPPDLKREVLTALSKLSLADAQSLAIRKYMSKSAYDNNVTPGPPLPKSHPSPNLLAKLHLECVSLYASAKSLAKTSASSNGVEIPTELRKYMSDKAAFHTALSHKWLGVEAGENGGPDRAGEAVGYLAWARKELDDLKDSGLTVQFGRSERERDNGIKPFLSDEVASVNNFYKYYNKMNDSLHFQPVPSQADLQASVPTGMSAAQLKPYELPPPAFTAQVIESVQHELGRLTLETESARSPSERPSKNSSKSPSYAGAGSYF